MEQLEMPGYKTEELTIDAAKAQVISIVYFLPFAIIFLPIYYFLWIDGLVRL